MRRRLFSLSLFLLALIASHAQSRPDKFTPVVVSAFTPNARPVAGTDGKTHLVYELILTNTNPTAATLQKLEVLDASAPSKVLSSFEGQDLLSHLHTTGGGGVDNAVIEFNGTRLFLIDFYLDSLAAVPKRLLHHLELLGAPAPARTPTTPVSLSYDAAPIEILAKVPVIGPPLAGNHWIATNGCCAPSVHRASSLGINGQIFFAQRFAIDWMQMDGQGRLVSGDPSDVHNYKSYGADVLAVADGTVVEKLNDLDDQKPGTLPDPKTITVQNVDGNHVVLDLGGGVYAFYAHMQKNSVDVAVGQRVKRGRVLGKLGNTGNTSAPHLHFHLMAGTSVLGSNGIPYEIDTFELAGQVSKEAFEKATGIEGVWNQELLPTPSVRHKEFPLDLNIINFPSGK